MALPTPEKTWEISANNKIFLSEGSDELSARLLAIIWFNYLTGKKKKAWGGTFTDQGAGTVRFTFTELAGRNPTRDPAIFESSDVGLNAVFVGSNSAANDGTFAITAVDNLSGLWCEFTNGSAVFEADSTVSMHVDDGIFTSPLTVKGSGAGTTGKGAAMDGRDRWLTVSDMQTSTSGTGNRSWIVLQTSSGAEMLFLHFTNSTSFEYDRAQWWFSPELGFTGGTANVAPTAVDGQLRWGNTSEWPPYFGINDSVHYFTVWISNDGQDMRMLSHGRGAMPNFICMERAKDPLSAGALIPWNGNQNVCTLRFNIDANAPIYSQLNDSAAQPVTIDKDGTAGGPYLALVLWTSEAFAAATVGQYLTFQPDLGRKQVLLPVGVWCGTTGVRGRHGRLSDVWWSNYLTLVPQGSTFPADGSGQFIKVGDLVLPWNGSAFTVR